MLDANNAWQNVPNAEFTSVERGGKKAVVARGLRGDVCGIEKP